MFQSQAVLGPKWLERLHNIYSLCVCLNPDLAQSILRTPEICFKHFVHSMFARISMTRLFRPPKLSTRLRPHLPRHFTPKFHGRERVEEEDIYDYDPARYCPIELGSMIDDSYTTLVKLGYGGTSTTWLCKERK